MTNRVCKLIYVAINDGKTAAKHQAKQSNKFYDMLENGDGTFTVKYGRVDATCTERQYPISKWDSTKRSKIKKGYKDITHLMVEDGDEPTTDSSMGDISDAVINRLFKELQAFATNSIRENYKVSSHKVTQLMIDEAQAKVDELAGLLKGKVVVGDFNQALLDLFHIIPRRMQDVNNHLVRDSGSATLQATCEKVLGDEQATLDVMAGQVVVNTKTDNAEEATVDVKKDILDVLGLEVAIADSKAETRIKKLMGANASNFRSAYAVVNKSTQKTFDKHMKTVDNDKTELFWHGSRNQNWLNILSTGLLIRPAGAIHTGSMFGDGIYFADKAQKSIGYTSLRGSYWSRGGDDKAYLALFSVHVGKQKVVENCQSHLSWSHMKKEGCDSTFARAGRSLRNNEYIVYRAQQCTVSYLVEIG